MNRRMLIGVLAAERPAPPGTPRHRQVRGSKWTGIVLDLQEAVDLDFAEDAADLAQSQHAVLCRYVADGDILPIAMGAVFSDDIAVKAHLQDIAPRLNSVARSMADHVEYSLALTKSDDTPVRSYAPSGAAHLRARQAKRNQLRSHDSTGMLQTVIASLNDLPTAHRLRGAQPGRMGAVDLLIRRDHWTACRAALDAIADQARANGFNLTATGPYPPFSFIEDRASD